MLDPGLLVAASPLAVVAAYSQGNSAIDAAGSVTNRTPYGLTPTQVRQAYGFNQVTFSNSKAAADGSGQTIAIVDAYDDPNIAADLTSFDATMGLSNTAANGVSVLTKVQMGTNMTSNAGWAMETALDVEWAHAIAPGAKILLVEAASNSYADLFNAVNYARSQTGVVTVSMSWGSGEFSSEKSYDSYFTTPAGHVGGSGLAGGVVFVASSGDSGAPPEYPAVSPNVLAVGGTSLSLGAGANYSSETGWSGSGGGVSSYETKPAFQANVAQSKTARTSPDVAYDANPSSGFAVYDTVAYSGQTGWFQVGGTSAGAPQWAALIAITDQARALRGLGSLTGSAALTGIYSLPAADFHDVTSGSNGYSAAKGYDLVTGRGSPLAAALIGGLTTPSTTLQTSAQLAGTATTTPAPASTGSQNIMQRSLWNSVWGQSPASTPPTLGGAAWWADASDSSWSGSASGSSFDLLPDAQTHHRHHRG
jgi:subtilase family serine protease